LLGLLNLAKLGERFWVFWGKNWVKFLGFWSGRLEDKNNVVSGMNWIVFEGKKLGFNWGRFGDYFEAKKIEGCNWGFLRG
jgi:hypothetical protein